VNSDPPPNGRGEGGGEGVGGGGQHTPNWTWISMGLPHPDPAWGGGLGTGSGKCPEFTCMCKPCVGWWISGPYSDKEEYTMGFLSAPMIQKICMTAEQDGLDHPDVSRIAKAGNYGQYPGNTHRDISQAFINGLPATHVR
jgi:hypothetical protein